jgi:hypothetical protein
LHIAATLIRCLPLRLRFEGVFAEIQTKTPLSRSQRAHYRNIKPFLIP